MRSRLSAAVLALGLAVTGCSSGQPKAKPLPSGFTRFEASAYTFAYPALWSLVRGDNEQGQPRIQVIGPPSATPGIPLGEIRVGRLVHPDLSAAEQLGQYRAAGTLTARQVVLDRDVHIAGAARAHRFDAVEFAVDAQGTRIRTEVTDLYVWTKNNVLLDFVLRAPQGGSAAARLPEVLASFQLRKGKTS